MMKPLGRSPDRSHAGAAHHVRGDGIPDRCRRRQAQTWVAAIFTPVVLAYQAWTYWVSRRRLTGAT
ncbi:hypothetical protein EJK15_38230 [Nonomuraea basaltis]|nr:hypothetical protein EJK15_38230 [Nonomuraea basaltis]